MDENKIISLENLNQYSDETSDKIKSYVDTKTSVIQDGTKTVGGVTAEDYNNFKGAYDDKHTHINKSVLDEISEKTLNGGAELSGSTGYTITDSVEYPLVGLKVYGKSTQDSTPTPENPVEIVSVVKPTVTMCGRNMLNPTAQTAVRYGVIVTNNGNGTYSLNGTATETFYFNLTDVIKLPKGNFKLVGKYMMAQFSLNGKTVWGTNFNTAVDDIKNLFVFIHSKSGEVFNNVTVKPMITTDFNATEDDYEPYTGNTITFSNTLNAIPVSSGGNVTIDGQEYIADYVDFGEGKYHRLVDPDKLDPTVSIVDNLDLLLEIEEITDIPEAEMHAYRQLHTYNGVTNISNDKGAGLEVSYCTSKALSTCVAPIASGLQKQIDDLKSAVLSLGGNV